VLLVALTLACALPTVGQPALVLQHEDDNEVCTVQRFAPAAP
jgi:hypothetical protein